MSAVGQRAAWRARRESPARRHPAVRAGVLRDGEGHAGGPVRVTPPTGRGEGGGGEGHAGGPVCVTPPTGRGGGG